MPILATALLIVTIAVIARLVYASRGMTHLSTMQKGLKTLVIIGAAAIALFAISQLLTLTAPALAVTLGLMMLGPKIGATGLILLGFFALS